MGKMNWDQLLNSERVRKSRSNARRYHNEFDKDYSRIVYSSSVRRLQNKAQVFPLQENDFPRTRLTHSLEVASLGESLAWNIGEWLLKDEELKDFWQVKELASMVKTACLVHDLGNPPFGHYGENIIGKWFENWFEENKDNNSVKDLSEQQKNDFIFFEGNAQGIRILTKLQRLNDEYGVNFTFGTLATLLKYPWLSDDEKAEETGGKFGVFASETNVFNLITEETGIGPHRHPATFILEAADDIAYLPTDIEDGVKKGSLTWTDIEESSIYDELEQYDSERFDKFLKKIDDLDYKRVPDRELTKMQNLKIEIQLIFIKEVVKTFKDNYESIMHGQFRGGLLEHSKASKLEESLREVCGQYVFNDNEVLRLELVGDKVISELLDLFVDATVNLDDASKAKEKDQKLYHLISNSFRYIILKQENYSEKDFGQIKLYPKLQLVTDYISGMTDNYALNLHQELLGVKMP